MPLWEDMVTTDFAALDPARAVALLPVAAIEQHGPHLPLGTDAILCDAILDRTQNIVADPASLLRLPTQRVGLSPEHAGFPGTLVLRAESLLTAWTEIGLSVAAAGVRKLVLFNTHGGQGGLVDIVAQQLRCRAGMLVVRCSSYRFALPEGWVPPDELRFGLHGGLIETSMMLAAAPESRQAWIHALVPLACGRLGGCPSGSGGGGGERHSLVCPGSRDRWRYRRCFSSDGGTGSAVAGPLCIAPGKDNRRSPLTGVSAAISTGRAVEQVMGACPLRSHVTLVLGGYAAEQRQPVDNSDTGCSERFDFVRVVCQ